MNTTRSISTIASEIIMDMEKIAKSKGKYWRNMFWSVGNRDGYLDAMLSLDKITDNYMFENGDMIVRCALDNMKTYKGETAKKLKNELRVILGMKPVK